MLGGAVADGVLMTDDDVRGTYCGSVVDDGV